MSTLRVRLRAILGDEQINLRKEFRKFARKERCQLGELDFQRIAKLVNA